jgi:class 3 adenylate cyclase
MDWLSSRGQTAQLTVQVFDIRASTSILHTQPLERHVTFLREVSGKLASVLRPLVERGHVHVSGFTGDGFLVFFDEHELGKLAPQWAVDSALEMRQAFRGLCTSERWQRHGFDRMALASGVASGWVYYGSVAVGPTEWITGIGNAVVRAFRLAGADDGSTVWVCSPTKDCLPAAGHYRLETRDLRGLGLEECYTVHTWNGPDQPRPI